MLSLSLDDRFGYLSTVGPIPDPKPRPRRVIDLHRFFLTLLAVTSGMLGALAPSDARRPAEYQRRLRWLAPALQNSVASQPVAFAWTPVVGADAYRLGVGSEPGAHDVVRSGWLRETHYTVDGLPGGRPLYARVLARRAGAWAHADLVFVASRRVAEWVYPRPGSADAEPGRAIEWTPIPEADEYSIAIGTKPGLFDLVRRSTGTRTSWLPSQLPVGRRLAGRLGTRIGTIWRFSEADFAIGLGYRQALPIFPAPDQYSDPRRPFVWSADPMASGYRLRIGSAEGRSELYDSGPIGVTGRFVEGLPPGRRLFATLTTVYADRALDAHFAFQAGTGSPGEREAIQAALDVTATVRGMAGYDAAWSRTILERVVRGLEVPGPGCVEFAHALLQALAEQRNPLPARRLATCLLGNFSDCHTLVELYLPSRGEWMLLDPTFAVAVRRRSDGEWATATDMMEAARRQDWGAVSIVPLASESVAALRSYYIDYPLLFMSPFGEGRPTVEGGPSILQYYEEAGLPLLGRPGSYAVRCSHEGSDDLLIDGKSSTVVCGGRDGLSAVRVVSSIEPPAGRGTAARVYRLRRFVF